MSDEIFESTIKGKVKFYGFIFLLLAFYALLQSDWLAKVLYTDTSSYSTEELIQHIYEQLNRPIIFSSVSLLVHFVIAFFVFQSAKRVKQSEQFPPPGANIPFSMKIKKGKSALRQAYGAYIGAVMIIINGLILLISAIYTASTLKELVGIV